MSRPQDVRLYAILARDAPRAILFRRGPSKQVLLIAWDTERDTFEEGQWLKGRIYERRCDLSPDGQLLIYFAAKQKKPYYTWTAISRPPYFTALALWPKGDAWGGGGLFRTRRHILLNHRAGEMELAPDFRVPKSMNVNALGTHSGWGEDDLIWSARLTREGWIAKSSGAYKRAGGRMFMTANPAIIWEKPHPRWPERYALGMSIRGIGERNGPWYVIDHEVFDYESDDCMALERSDWADWLPNGDLAYAHHGKLYRWECEAKKFSLSREPRVIADFADRKFRELAAPPEAERWPQPKRRTR
jgi:hypothetical protein